MSKHTKRSPKFKQEIEDLIEKHLMRVWGGGDGAFDGGINRIIEILRKNTTDAPCMVKAAEDEPVFVLRGKDPDAPGAIERWAENRSIRFQLRDHEGRTRPGAPTEELLKVEDARIAARGFAEFREYGRDDHQCERTGDAHCGAVAG